MKAEFKSFSGLSTEPAESTQRVLRHAGVGIQWVFPCLLVTEVTATPKVIGRDHECDVVLPGRETSRRHAEVRRAGPFAEIRDLESRNGVFVNGQRVTQVCLKANDVVRLGDGVGIVAAYAAEADNAFRDVAPGWYGGAALAAAVEPARRAAQSELAITIEGETGTGKEGLAQAIHSWSGRRGQLVAVNCATIQPELAEATLFGHRKGAFTGADRAAVGYFRAADAGTLLLDEVIELPLSVQAKLLRALEEHEVIPVGETQPVPVNVRVLAAMQEPLARAVSERRFRADLMARLEGLTVVPPRFATATQEEVAKPLSDSVPSKPTRNATQDEAAFDQLVTALRAHAGNVARAAASIGISRARAYRLLEARPDFDVAQLRAPGERS